MWRAKVRGQKSEVRGQRAFALYEVLLGVSIFVIGVLALGRAAENCLSASTLSAEEDRVRQVLSNRMAEIQATPGVPDSAKELKIDTGYGVVNVVQKTAPAGLKEPANVVQGTGPADVKNPEGAELTGVNLVTLTAKWVRDGNPQSKSIEFYVYRTGQ